MRNSRKPADVACCGFILTIDAVSRERHDQTLELLLLTRVKIWDVLAGKLGASGFAGLFGIVAFLPVLMIPVLAGGLTLAEILRKGLVLLNTLFFSLAVGLWASAARRRWLRVIGMVFVVFILPLFFDDTMAAPLKVSLTTVWMDVLPVVSRLSVTGPFGPVSVNALAGGPAK